MKAIGLALVGALALAGCASTRPAPTETREDARPAVQAALARWNEAAGRGDLAGMMAQLDDRAEVLLVGSDTGEVFAGRPAIETWLARLFRNARFTWKMDRVDVDANGDTAWVFVEGAMSVTDKAGKPRGSTPYRFSGVLVRRDGGWAWRQWHGSIPRAE